MSEVIPAEERKPGSEKNDAADSQPEGGPEEDKPAAWGAAAAHESPWPPVVAILVAGILYLTLDRRFAIPVSSWVVPALEAALLVPLIFTRLKFGPKGSSVARFLSLTLIALINAVNLFSLVKLLQFLIAGTSIPGGSLLVSAGQIWVTNVIVFGLWYWELDRGGPYRRRSAHHRQPDFLFPQMVTPEAAPEGWYPDFMDYLYTSFTNATAFSPTDTMPLTHWAKALFMVQSFASLVTVGLVAARVVNILQGSGKS